MKMKKFIIFFIVLVCCSTYNNEYKNDIINSYKELSNIPAGVDKNGDITLESIEFHCEFASESIEDYKNDNLLISDFVELHYATFRQTFKNQPIEEVEKFMTTLYKYCNLEQEFIQGWTSLDELEQIYLSSYKQ